MKLYCISGLGADQRIFKFLNLRAIEIVPIEWIKPKPNESLPTYAHRLIDQIDPSEDFALMGVSFGGMLAGQIASMIQPKHLFLVSTVQSSSELRILYRLLGIIKLHQLIPAAMIGKSNALTNWYFGLDKPDHKALFQSIMQHTDPYFFRWALGAILGWRGECHAPHTRIHSSLDRLIPLRKSTADYVIADGGHLVVMTHADQVSEIINTKLAEQNSQLTAMGNR